MNSSKFCYCQGIQIYETMNDTMSAFAEGTILPLKKTLFIGTWKTMEANIIASYCSLSQCLILERIGLMI